MSTSILGKAVDETGTGIPSLTIQVLESQGLHGDVQLGVGQTDPLGDFFFPFTALPTFRHTLRVRVYGAAQRLLSEIDVQDTASVNVTVNFTLPSLDSEDTLHRTSGNTVEFLIDDESAWERLTDAVHAATNFVHFQPFGFDISEYAPDIKTVEPTLITKFPTKPLAGLRTDRVQLERELADACDRGVRVCLLMHHSALWRPFSLWDRFFIQFLDLILALGLPDDSRRLNAILRIARPTRVAAEKQRKCGLLIWTGRRTPRWRSLTSRHFYLARLSFRNTSM